MEFVCLLASGIKIVEVKHTVQVNMILPALATVAGMIAVAISYQKLKAKPKKPLQVGDTVIVAHKYSREYKDLPPYGLNITNLDDHYATVVYMHQTDNKICTSQVSKDILKVVNAKRG